MSASALCGALTAAALLAGLLAIPSGAQACSCTPGTAEEHFAAASAVFEGRVASIVRTGDPDVGPARLEVTFEVVQTWKAANVEHLIVTTSSDGAACGVAFEQGRSYLVYASTGDDGALIASLCGGTLPREDADGIVVAMGAGVTPVDVTDEAPAAQPRATAPGAGGCASCDVGARREAAPRALWGALLVVVALARRRLRARRAA